MKQYGKVPAQIWGEAVSLTRMVKGDIGREKDYWGVSWHEWFTALPCR